MMAPGLEGNLLASPPLLAVQRDLVGLGESGQESDGDGGELHDGGFCAKDVKGFVEKVKMCIATVVRKCSMREAV